MARVIATDLDGELSLNGSLTNPLFVRSGNRAQVGDVGTVTIKVDTAGWEARNFTLRCTPGIALSLGGVTYGADGASLYLGTVTSAGTVVHVKATSASATVVSLLVDQSTLVFVAVQNVNVSADTLSLTSALQASTQTGTALVAPDALSLTAVARDASVDVAGSVSVPVDALSMTAALFAPSITGDASVEPATLALTAATQDPTVSLSISLFDTSLASYSLTTANWYQRFSIYIVDAADATVATICTNQVGSYIVSGVAGGSNPTVSVASQVVIEPTYKVKVVREFSASVGGTFDVIAHTQTTTSSATNGYAIMPGTIVFTGLDMTYSGGGNAGSGTIGLPYTTSPFWADDFEDGSISTALWNVTTADGGAVTETGGQLVADTYSTVAHKIMAESVRPIRFDTSGKVTVTSVVGAVTPTTNSINIFSLFKTAGLNTGSTLTGLAATSVSVRSDLDTYIINYTDSSAVTHYWTGSAWTTTNTSIAQTWDTNDVADVVFECNGTQVRWTVKRGGTTLTTTDWVTASTLNGNPLGYLMIRDTSATIGYTQKFNAVTYEAV